MESTLSHLYQKAKGEWVIQTNEIHQQQVAHLAESFASLFGMSMFGRVAGLLHDAGKCRKSFQDYIKKNSGYDPSIRSVAEHNHAFVGGIIAKQLFGDWAQQLIVNPIISHHTGLHDYDEINSIISSDKLPPEIEIDSSCFSKESLILQLKNSLRCLQPQDFHHVSRMLFSCLVDADRLDTEAFMQANLAKLRGPNTTLFNLLPKLETYLAELKHSATCSEVNQIRDFVQQQCADQASQPKGFYSLTVPTGGGKTLSSVLWALKHAVHNGLRRIIIAIPYTSIIVQTAGILKSIFGDENVLEHHSHVDYSQIKDEKLRQQLELATENWDFPIIVTTNVQLFESMFSNKPADCRKLHNICNSIIILDEVQSLPTGFLQPIVDSLKTYRQLFGISVLFTTASQPILSGLITGCNHRAHFNGIDHIQEIIPPDALLHHKLRRVRLEVDDEGKNYDEVVRLLCQHKRVLCIVNTRKEAKELYDRLPDEGVKLHLSRMMCPVHVSQTLAFIKQVLCDDRQPILRVISTQLVEAGVDIDFPVVFRQEAGLDSVLQAAGRCNREGKLMQGTTFVFSLSSERNLPVGMRAANDARKSLGTDKDWFAPQTMIDYFRQLYSRQETFDQKTIKQYLYNPNELSFATAAQSFRLIEDIGYSVIVNWEDSLQFVEQLKQDGITYPLMRQLSKYSVNIYPRDFQELIHYGVIEEVVESIYVVRDRAQYDPKIGLRLDNHWMDEILTV